MLLDAPCSSTGTIRRHPDVPWLKGEADLAVLTSLQQRLLDRAVDLLKPGGTLVYCVCSLEPEEAEQQIAALLARDASVARKPITAADVFGRGEFVSAEGDLRTLPLQLARPRSALGRARRLLMPPGSSAINDFPLGFQAYWPAVGPSLSWRRLRGEFGRHGGRAAQ